MEFTGRNTGSFRDPSGFIFHEKGRVLRGIMPRAKAQYESVRDSGLIQKSIERGFLVPTREIPREEWPADLSACSYVVEHEPVPYVSYPYEWSFFQLKTAALHHLDFQLMLLEEGAILTDATAYNIQFWGHQPRFIDLLSLAPYREGQYWLGHRQFCEQFLNPLLLRSKKGVPHHSWYRGGMKGISSREMASLLSFKDKFSWNVFSQVVLLAKFESAALSNPDGSISKIKKAPSMSRASYRAFLSQIRGWIAKLEPRDSHKTVWIDYAKQNTYEAKETDLKRQFIEKFVAERKPRLLLDLGCNTGDYCFSAIASGAAYVVGIDYDYQAVEVASRRSQEKRAPFLALCQDISNPSPSQGWRQKEREGLFERATPDALIALAFVHHLAIGNNIPLDQIVEWIVGLAPAGIIEFVPKADTTVRRMLALREDIFDDYSEEAFVKALAARAKIVDSLEVSKEGRRLFCFSRAN